MLFEFFDFLQNHPLIAIDVESQVLRPHADVVATRQFAHYNPHLITHQIGIDVLIAIGEFGHGLGVNPPFMRKGTPTDKGGMMVRVKVANIGYDMRNNTQPLDLDRRNPAIPQL